MQWNWNSNASLRGRALARMYSEEMKERIRASETKKLPEKSTTATRLYQADPQAGIELQGSAESDIAQP
jgi:hypothetical protein